ncbi:MAG: SpoIID/LytB domain-containing protein [bacterium]|nr:SpoIID/LytB domain-containing protein [bacterium]
MGDKFLFLKPKLFIILLFLLIFSVLGHWPLVTTTLAVSESDCLNKSPRELTSGEMDECINTILPRIAAAYAPAQAQNKAELANLNKQLAGLNSRINGLSAQLKTIASEMSKREEDLAYTREIFNEKAKNHYTFLRIYDPIIPFLFSDSAPDAFREIVFRQRAADKDRKTLEEYASDLAKLKNDKESLEKNKVSLAAVQKQVSEKTNFLAGEVAKVDTYLATLSAKQQAFLAQKLESLGLSRSAYNMKGGCSSDINPYKNPGFSPAFAFFSFGVPNRVGINQFGAKGRAEAGQNYEQILRAYYNADITSGYNVGITIRVNGTNEFGQSFNDNWNIEDYLKHLYEMPTGWHSEALKAQAIAARSYALSYTDNGAKSICPSQKCQVVKKELNDGAWQAAVEATRGIVLTNGGKPVTAWYSSTHGGYAYTSGDIGWSQTSWTKRLVDSSGGVSGFSDLFNNSYDKSSPIFYCDWGSRAAYNKTAWLKPEEAADVANVILLAKADGSTQKHLVQIDKTNPDGVDTWDAERIKNELRNRGITPLNSVSSVSVGADFGSGRTTAVTIDGVFFDGQDFKTYFNLRAPANIQIVGPLFNIEKR